MQDILGGRTGDSRRTRKRLLEESLDGGVEKEVLVASHPTAEK